MDDFERLVLRDLAEGLGITDLKQEDQERIATRVGNYIFSKVMWILFQKLPESKMDEFNMLKDSRNNEEEGLAFLLANVPEAEALVQRVAQVIIDDDKENDWLTYRYRAENVWSPNENSSHL